MDRDEHPFSGSAGSVDGGVCLLEEAAPDAAPVDVQPDVQSDAPLDMQSDVQSEPIPVADVAQPHFSGEPEPQAELEPAQVIEALLFSADIPLSAARLAELSGRVPAREVPVLVEVLNEKYAAAGLSFRIEGIARGYQMLTLPAYQPWLVKLDKQRGQARLSAAALETLSIVAYKQPVIRADIEAIRGVASGEVLTRLREIGLVKIVGRAEIIGRPMLYGTTRKFLDTFGLEDLDDLPPMETLSLRRSSAVTTPPVASAEPVPEMPAAAAGA